MTVLDCSRYLTNYKITKLIDFIMSAKQSRNNDRRYLRVVVLAAFAMSVTVVTGECPKVTNKEEFTFTVGVVCYHYVENPEQQVTYDLAESDCASRSGHLVTVKNNNTQIALVDNLKHRSESHTVLIGLRKQGTDWKWATGESLAYSHWETSTTCSNCACAKMKMQSEGRWEQFDCQTSDWFTVYICEHDPTTSSGSGFNNGHPISIAVLALLSVVIKLAISWLCH